MNELKEKADQYLREHRIIELFEVNFADFNQKPPKSIIINK